jgi:hypothetical protein
MPSCGNGGTRSRGDKAKGRGVGGQINPYYRGDRVMSAGEDPQAGRRATSVRNPGAGRQDRAARGGEDIKHHFRARLSTSNSA